jgi:hypothetical protein
MAKYTMELREVISSFGEDTVKGWFSDYELADFLTPEQIRVIEENGVWSKDQLAQRIMNHFYTRELGTDAIGQFILFAKDKMDELMETYAPIIYSASIKFNPIENVNMTETYTGNVDSRSDSTSNSKGSGLNVESDTPQGQINKSDILTGKFASSTGASENENEIKDISQNATNQDWTRKSQGNSGQLVTRMLNDYRKIIRSINTEIVYELEPLFMGIY